MLAGFRRLYAGAMLAQALSAAAKTGTLLILRYLVDDVLMRDQILQMVDRLKLHRDGRH